MLIFSIIMSLFIGFSISLLIVSKYVGESNDYGNDFGELYDIVQSSFKITEKRDKTKQP
ncbi:MAG: hypothetical protein IJ661_04215 [Lachnospiraceae bacterium]|nr:hypothetical protein [Lachnospiraceae bacterium]